MTGLSDKYQHTSTSDARHSFILLHLLDGISPRPSVGPLSAGPGAARRNPKLLEANIDLLAALIKGQPDLAVEVRRWPRIALPPVAVIDEGEADGFVAEMLLLLKGSSTAVRIAIASW
jgi:hypothetical protein